MKLYLIRHGESETNLERRHTGQYQAKLTGKGEADARRAGELLRGAAFDKVYTSDLIRAVHTSELALPGIVSEKTPLIREIDVGSLEGKPIDMTGELYGEVYLECRRSIDYTPYGGEDYAALRARVEKFLDIVTESGYERVAAFCHGGVIAAVFEYVLGTRLDRASFRCDNGGVSVIEYTGKRWRIVCWNCTDIMG